LSLVTRYGARMGREQERRNEIRDSSGMRRAENPISTPLVFRLMTDKLHSKIIMLMGATTVLTFGTLVGSYQLLLG
jgi:hypothetical protein